MEHQSIVDTQIYELQIYTNLKSLDFSNYLNAFTDQLIKMGRFGGSGVYKKWTLISYSIDLGSTNARRPLFRA